MPAVLPTPRLPQFVCDFKALAGQTLYLWNIQDDDRMKDVPFFCYSHLVMKIAVGPACTTVRSKTSQW
jgi:hypothetical protein